MGGENGRVIGTSADKALTKIEIGDSELPRPNHRYDPDVDPISNGNGEVTANKVITILLQL